MASAFQQGSSPEDRRRGAVFAKQKIQAEMCLQEAEKMGLEGKGSPKALGYDGRLYSGDSETS